MRNKNLSSLLSCLIPIATNVILFLPPFVNGFLTSTFLITKHPVLNHNLYAANVDLSTIEQKALEASEMWDVYSTGFLSSEQSTMVDEQMRGRADVGCLRIPSCDDSQRKKFVFTNPELELDFKEYVSVLVARQINLSSVDPWPNVLESIGVALDDVGDIVVNADDEVVIVADASVVKNLKRLLPKVLPGNGVSIEEFSDDGLPSIVDYLKDVYSNGSIQDMVWKRLDKRQQK